MSYFFNLKIADSMNPNHKIADKTHKEATI